MDVGFLFDWDGVVIDSHAQHEDSWTLAGTANDAYVNFYHDLYQTIRGDKSLVITAENVRRVIWLQEECHRLNPLTQTFF